MEYASDRLKNDIEIVSVAIENSIFCPLLSASDNLRHNRELMLKSVNHDGDLVQRIPHTHADFEIMLAAVKNSGDALSYVAVSPLTNPRFIRSVI